MIVQGWGRGTGTPGDDIILHNAAYSKSNGGRFTLSSSGTATGDDVAVSGPLSYAWLNEGAASDYQAYCQVVSGSVTGSTGAWLALTSNRAWSYSKPSDGSSTILVSIRQVATGSVITSATIVLSKP